MDQARVAEFISLAKKVETTTVAHGAHTALHEQGPVLNSFPGPQCAKKDGPTKSDGDYTISQGDESITTAKQCPNWHLMDKGGTAHDIEWSFRFAQEAIY
ncbi:hypothetical protein NDU88_003213 [Pleurodeles waltl]|uniref:Uncharacterized protein n=1 Tax=Pleurodeles waltl TaxID=8319 RepID=A0AAV7LMB8_PLEWA|nr:hypothetical protein NDU88_003213 [Pleurodeles waltl]